MNYYAEVDSDNVVTSVYTSEHDAGHPEVVAHFAGRGRWVYVEKECEIGDGLIIDKNGCAKLAYVWMKR